MKIQIIVVKSLINIYLFFLGREIMSHCTDCVIINYFQTAHAMPESKLSLKRRDGARVYEKHAL